MTHKAAIPDIIYTWNGNKRVKVSCNVLCMYFRIVDKQKAEAMILSNKNKLCILKGGKSSPLYLMFSHSSNNKGTHHSRQRSHTIRNAHQDAGIARSNIQMIDIETW